MNSDKGFPRVVHHIWYNFKQWGDVEPLPEKHEQVRLAWRAQNPSWEFVLWNEQSSLRLLQSYPEFYDKFMEYTAPIQRADYFRWVVLYLFGGCYMDTDCHMLQPLDTLLDRHFAAHFARHFAEQFAKHVDDNDKKHLLVVPESSWAANAMIFATPAHPAILTLLKTMPTSSWFGSNSVLGVFFTTGPATVRSLLNKEESGVEFDPDLMWHAPNGKQPANRPFIARHVGEGSWDFKRLLLNDITKLVTLVVAIVLILCMLAYVVMKSPRGHSMDSQPQLVASDVNMNQLWTKNV